MIFRSLLYGLCAGTLGNFAGATPISGHQASSPLSLLMSRQSNDSDSGCGEHGPNNRRCWDGRQYTLTLTNQTDYDGADGVPRLAMLINDQFPGPTIEADWGDWVEINVVNEADHNGTSFHWHGIWQKFTNTEDGANGATECPIPPGSSKTYRFKMNQYGTGWYHSHFSAQYGNGVAGSIVVNGPASADYDVDLGPFFLTDWYHDTAEQVEWVAEHTDGLPPASDNILFNGTNINNEGGGRYSRTRLEKGKKHRLRLINGSADNGLTVSLVDHNFTVIAADFVPVEPVVKDTLFLTVGQRYDIIIDADKDADSSYWFNATLQEGGFCGKTHLPFPAAIFSYDDAAEDDIPTKQGEPVTAGCGDSHSDLEPVVTKGAPRDEFQSSERYLDVTRTYGPVDNTTGPDVNRWYINDIDIDVEWGHPILEYVSNGSDNWPERANVVINDKPNVWTWWVIENESLAPHPMHLHGHDFLVLGAGDCGTGGCSFDPERDMDLLNFDNPMRRDVAQLPGGGWLVMAFETDNPGAHLMHCHIAWHASRGLSVQFLERSDDIADSLEYDLSERLEENCQAWRKYEENMIYPKSDSGL